MRVGFLGCNLVGPGHLHCLSAYPPPQVIASPQASSPVSTADYSVPHMGQGGLRRPEGSGRVVAARQMWGGSDTGGWVRSVTGTQRCGASKSLLGSSLGLGHQRRQGVLPARCAELCLALRGPGDTLPHTHIPEPLSRGMLPPCELGIPWDPRAACR